MDLMRVSRVLCKCYLIDGERSPLQKVMLEQFTMKFSLPPSSIAEQPGHWSGARSGCIAVKYPCSSHIP